MSELKPCPFCGHEPELNSISLFGIKVLCPNCKASTKIFNAAYEGELVTMMAWNNDFIYFPHEEIPYKLFKALDRIASEAGNSK